MTIPVRTFSANSGSKSTGVAGPDALETDIDSLIRMFNPSASTAAGVTHVNLRDSVLPATSSGRAKMANGFITTQHLSTGLVENATIAAHRGLATLDHPDFSVTNAKLAANIAFPSGLTSGDILYRASGSVWARLAKGTFDQILRMNSGATALEWFTIPMVRVYHSSNQSIANATYTAPSFNSERYDNNTMHDTVVDNSRLICKTAGMYRITANVQWEANGTGIRGIYLNLNGTTVIAFEQIIAASATLKTIQHISTTYALAINDYVLAGVYQNSGGALLVEYAANYSPEFMMERVG